MTVENRISSVFNDFIDDIFDKGYLSRYIARKINLFDRGIIYAVEIFYSN